MPPVRLPVPPSANKLWKAVLHGTRRGVALAKGYAAWRDEAVLLMRLGLPVVRAYPIGVRILIAGGHGWADGRDLDNAAKAVLDAARHAGRIADDTTAHVQRIEMQYLAPADPKQAAYCLLELVEPNGGN